jgi:SRSO17 transposase
VRTLQEFLVTARWDQQRARDRLQQDLAAAVPAFRADELGTVGVIDETSCQKRGDQTPGVQRQYLGCAGKVDNGIVTVHVGVPQGRFQALLDADLYPPEAWDQDRQRCRVAGIRGDVRYRPKWRIALDRLVRLSGNGLRFDWLLFDEAYGAAVPVVRILGLVGQRSVAAAPANLAVRGRGAGAGRRAERGLTRADAKAGWRYRLAHHTVGDMVCRVTEAAVWVADHLQRPIVAINEATAEVKYFLTNAAGVPLARVLAVAFRRGAVEHAFRLGKQEAGLMHYEGRDYLGLTRHLLLALVVLGFVALHTERLRGEKSPGHGGAGVPGRESAVRDAVPPSPGRTGDPTHQRSHPIPPATKPASSAVPQKAAA